MSPRSNYVLQGKRQGLGKEARTGRLWNWVRWSRENPKEAESHHHIQDWCQGLYRISDQKEKQVKGQSEPGSLHVRFVCTVLEYKIYPYVIYKEDTGNKISFPSLNYNPFPVVSHMFFLKGGCHATCAHTRLHDTIYKNFVFCYPYRMQLIPASHQEQKTHANFEHISSLYKIHRQGAGKNQAILQKITWKEGHLWCNCSLFIPDAMGIFFLTEYLNQNTNHFDKRILDNSTWVGSFLDNSKQVAMLSLQRQNKMGVSGNGKINSLFQHKVSWDRVRLCPMNDACILRLMQKEAEIGGDTRKSPD